jgi:CRP-like cAMP-binding protein
VAVIADSATQALATERVDFALPPEVGAPVLPQSNLLLASLSKADSAALAPHLQSVQLAAQRVLFEAGDTIDRVYFPSGSIVSLVVTLSTGEMIEAAMVGRDGVIGAAAALDGKVSLSRAIVQIAGGAMTCELGALKNAAMRSQLLLSLLIRHEQTVYAQAQQSAACNATHDVEARLCRWMLRARDLSVSDTLPFTQEFLAEMLGVRRTSVSLVAHTLQQAGMIKYTRGRIQITNLEGLRETACECYGTVNSNYQALLSNNTK